MENEKLKEFHYGAKHQIIDASDEELSQAASRVPPPVGSALGEHFNEELEKSRNYSRPPSLTVGENAILQDIERQEQVEDDARKQTSLGSKISSFNSTLNADQRQQHPLRKPSMDFMHPRTRRLTNETLEYNNKVFQVSPTNSLRQFFGFLDAMIPKLQHRCNIYMAILLILVLLILGDSFEHVYSWLSLFFCMVFIDIVTAVLDNMFFIYIIDKLFAAQFEIAYLLNGFNGPLGLLAEVLIAQSILRGRFEATHTLPYWHRLVSASAIVIIFMCVKNWYARSHYISLLEKRFTDRVLKLETWTILLSELSTLKPPKSHTQRAPPLPHHVEHANKAQSGGIPRQNTLNHLNGVLGDLNKKVHKKVVDVFADLVDATNKWNDESEEDIDVIKAIRESATTKGFRTGKESTNFPVFQKRSLFQQ